MQSYLHTLGLRTSIILLVVIIVARVVALRMAGSKTRTGTENPDYRKKTKKIIKICVVWVVTVGFLIYFWNLINPMPKP